MNRYFMPTTSPVAGGRRLPTDVLMKYALETNRQNEAAQQDADMLRELYTSTSGRLSQADAPRFTQEFGRFSQALDEVEASGDYRAQAARVRQLGRELKTSLTDPQGFYAQASARYANLQKMAQDLEADRDKTNNRNVYTANRMRLQRELQKPFEQRTQGFSLLQNPDDHAFNYNQFASGLPTERATIAGKWETDESTGRQVRRLTTVERRTGEFIKNAATAAALEDRRYLNNLQLEAGAEYEIASMELEDAGQTERLKTIQDPETGLSRRETRQEFINRRVQEEVDRAATSAAYAYQRHDETFTENWYGGGNDPNSPGGGSGLFPPNSMTAQIMLPVGTDYEDVGDLATLWKNTRGNVDAVRAHITRLEGEKRSRLANISDPRERERMERELNAEIAAEEQRAEIEIGKANRTENFLRTQAEYAGFPLEALEGRDAVEDSLGSILSELQQLYAQIEAGIDDPAAMEQARSRAEILETRRNLARRYLDSTKPEPLTTRSSSRDDEGWFWKGLRAVSVGSGYTRPEVYSWSTIPQDRLKKFREDVNRSIGRHTLTAEFFPFTTESQERAGRNLTSLVSASEDGIASGGAEWLSGEQAGQQVSAEVLKSINDTRPSGVVLAGPDSYALVFEAFDADGKRLGTFRSTDAGISADNMVRYGLMRPETIVVNRLLWEGASQPGAEVPLGDGYKLRYEQSTTRNGPKSGYINLVGPDGATLQVPGIGQTRPANQAELTTQGLQLIRHYQELRRKAAEEAK